MANAGFPYPDVLRLAASGKYTRWVSRESFDADALDAVLCAVGLMGRGAAGLLGWFHAELDRLPEWQAANLGRSVLAVEGLCLLARGERFSRESWMLEVKARRHSLRAPFPFADAADSAWATSPPLGEDDLDCVLWLVGEVPARLFPHDAALADTRFDDPDAERARVAVLALKRIVGGERFGSAELYRRLARGRADLRWEDLPGPARAVLATDRWGPGAWLRGDTYEVPSREPSDTSTSAFVRADGAFAVMRHVEWSAVPVAVQAAALAIAGDLVPRPFARATLDGRGAVVAYEVTMEPAAGPGLPVTCSFTPEGRACAA